MIHFTEHIPSCCDYGEPAELDFETLEDLLKDLQSHYTFCPPNYNFVWSYGHCFKQALMMSSTTKKEWYVMGYVTGINLSNYLPKFDEVYKNKKELNN